MHLPWMTLQRSSAPVRSLAARGRSTNQTPDSERSTTPRHSQLANSIQCSYGTEAISLEVRTFIQLNDDKMVHLVALAKDVTC
jgi:hypothetical protein